jgi:hypothetical protein
MGVGGQGHPPVALTPVKTHCVGGWVGTRAVLDGYGKFRRYWKLISGTVQSVTNCSSD